MIRNLKAMGLALVAVFAMSAVAASGASAASFDSTADHTILFGEQVGLNEFETGAGITECAEAIFEGTSNSTSAPEVTIEPTFDICETFGLESEVDMNGCDFLITASGQVHVECEPGEHIEVTVLPTFVHENNEHTDYFCAITVFEQTVNGISFVNTGTGATRDIDVIADVTNGITYEVDKGDGLCGEEGVLTHDGKYRGTVTVEGFNTTGGHVGIERTS